MWRKILPEKAMLFSDPDIFDSGNPDMDIRKLLEHPIVTRLREEHLLNETKIRNLKIRQEYKELRRQFDALESKFRLMDKYFLSFDSIEDILFRK